MSNLITTLDLTLVMGRRHEQRWSIREPRLSYTREQLLACEGTSIPDLIGEDCRLLFVGINPGLQTAMTGIHFAHPSNRFWPALRRAGLIDWTPNVSPAAPSVKIELPDQTGPAARQTHLSHQSDPVYPALRRGELFDWQVDSSTGMTDEQLHDFTGRSMGITNLVNRATARASELGREELREGAEKLRLLVQDMKPIVVAVAGITAYREAFTDRAAGPGLQPHSIAGSQVWVVPNPSGLNAHETVDSLADRYLEVARAAGIA